MSRLGTETAFEVLARARALEARGRHVVHLEIGEPDFDTPAFIKQAAVQALEEGYTHYTPAAGLPQAREAVARYVSRTRGLSVDPSEVVITPGGKPVMSFAILALVDAGEEVIYPNPGFPIYESMIRWVGAVPKPLPLREEHDFRADPDELRDLVSPRTRMLILNSPHNPCGSVLSLQDVAAIAEICTERDIYVLSDEIYSRILYDTEHVSIAAFPGMRERTILLDGFSKTYAMTGWRLGYGVMPPRVAQAVTQLMINVNSCTAAFTQIAGIAALEGPQEEVDAMVAEFRHRRDAIVAGLNAIEGIRCRPPAGAFYAFPNVSALDPDGRRFADYLLDEAGVAVLAGTAFGEYGRGYLRISYANSLANIQEALRRIGEAARAFRSEVRA
ncbi:MAG: pyridoxal phosphate-dependent aminotransferase [Armatimonadota bacterium]|nr:pyridoxal phosphate-dependent aminotransferase [Armatimonadota bacterium]MDR5697322.1 pyridoxal phosphate-dependent aminotransferase [Armatimonadota bacterium]